VARGIDRFDGVLLLSLFALPWVVLVYDAAPGTATFVFAWGLVNPAGGVTTLPGFLARAGALPDWILAWPAGVVCLVAAVAILAWARTRGREESTVAAALLALVALASLSVALGFAAQPGRTGVPLGSVIAGVAAVRFWRRSRA